jgi:hypothetical protein
MVAPLLLPPDHPLETIGTPGEHYGQPTILFNCSEVLSVAFVSRCQASTKWNIKKSRKEDHNKARAARNGVWRQFYDLEALLMESVAHSGAVQG